jgi:K+-transporting ATPase ATPase A chain
MRWAMDPITMNRPAARVDRWFRAIGGRAAQAGQDWQQYCVALLVFNVVMFSLSFGFMALQEWLPLNPDGKTALEGSLVFNTAASFTTNTNLQHYSGEVSMSHLSQLCALMWPQFVAAATGIAALTAMARGLAGRPTLGNFYVDLQRATFLVLLPMAVVVAVLNVLGGMPMTLAGAAKATTLEGHRATGHRARAGGGVRGHQATRHQRRRLLRTQQHAPVREPHLLHQCRGFDGGDRAHPDGLCVDVWPHRGPHAARSRRVWS